MLEHEGLEAVVIVTVTKVHAEMSVRAVERGLHVLCEKPLSTDIKAVCQFPHRHFTYQFKSPCELY